MYIKELGYNIREVNEDVNYKVVSFNDIKEIDFWGYKWKEFPEKYDIIEGANDKWQWLILENGARKICFREHGNFLVKRFELIEDFNDEDWNTFSKLVDETLQDNSNPDETYVSSMVELIWGKQTTVSENDKKKAMEIVLTKIKEKFGEVAKQEVVRDKGKLRNFLDRLITGTKRIFGNKKFWLIAVIVGMLGGFAVGTGTETEIKVIPTKQIKIPDNIDIVSDALEKIQEIKQEKVEGIVKGSDANYAYGYKGWKNTDNSKEIETLEQYNKNITLADEIIQKNLLTIGQISQVLSYIELDKVKDDEVIFIRIFNNSGNIPNDFVEIGHKADVNKLQNKIEHGLKLWDDFLKIAEKNTYTIKNLSNNNADWKNIGNEININNIKAIGIAKNLETVSSDISHQSNNLIQKIKDNKAVYFDVYTMDSLDYKNMNSKNTSPLFNGAGKINNKSYYSFFKESTT